MFAIDIPFLNLDQIYNSGQVYRWKKFRDGKYGIPHGSKYLAVEQRKDTFIMDCSDEDFYNIWYEYFDVSTDYMNLNCLSRGIDKEFKPLAVRARGVRILKQDLFEVIISSMLYSGSGTKYLVDKLTKATGTQHTHTVRDCGHVKWYGFPTPYMILEGRSRLDTFLSPKQRGSICYFCKCIENGKIDLEDLKYMGYEDVLDILYSFGVMEYDAIDRTCLYGLHMMDVYIDEPCINRLLKSRFGCGDFEDFKDCWMDGIGLSKYIGLIQQYFIYNAINPPREVSR